MQISFPFRHFPLRRMQDAKSVMQVPVTILQSADNWTRFAWSGMQIARRVMHSADNRKPPLWDGFL